MFTFNSFNYFILFFITFSNIVLVLPSPPFVSSHEIHSSSQFKACGAIPGLGSTDIRTQVPWTAGLYTRSSSTAPFKFRVSGIILGENMILTLFGGPFGGPDYRIEEEDNYLVAVGLKSTNLREGDQHTQLSFVSYVQPYYFPSTNKETLSKTNINNGTTTIHDDSYNKYHYVLFHLKRKFDLSTPFVRSACLSQEDPNGGNGKDDEGFGIDEGNDDQRVIRNQFDGFLGGFSSPAALEKGGFPLYRIRFKTEDGEQCTNAFKYHYYMREMNDKRTNLLCGRQESRVMSNFQFNEGGEEQGLDLRTLKDDENERCLLHGSSLISYGQNGNSQNVLGILALIPKRIGGKCNANTLYFFGNLHLLSSWITKNLICTEKEMHACGDGTCIPFTSLCNVKIDCNDGSDENEDYCKATLRSNCSSGHQCHLYGKCIEKEKVCDGNPDCPDGTDEEFKLCLKKQKIEEYVGKFRTSPSMSPAIEKNEKISCVAIPHYEGVKFICQDRNKRIVPCNKDAEEEGTVLTRSCAEFFVSKQRYKYLRMTCGPDGKWAPFKAFVCKADCGTINRDEKRSPAPFIANGRPVNSKNGFPWHAAIFKKDSNGTFRYFCGGSLIEKNVIVSAAHCVIDEKNDIVAFDSIRVVLAPLSPTYEENVDDPHAAIFNVKGIWKPRTFHSSSLRSDISLIQLDKPVKYTSFIRPVCYLISHQKPTVGKLGKVPGFGADNFGKVSQDLTFAQIPTAEPTACEKNLNVKLSQTMFCGGFKNGTISTCQGDSGGGFVFSETVGSSHRKYVLKGIVSYGRKPEGEYCSDKSFNVFSHVDSFNDWILDILGKINSDNNNEHT